MIEETQAYRASRRFRHILPTLMVIGALLFAVLAFYSTSFGELRPVLYGDADMLIIPSLYNDVRNGVDIAGWRVSLATFFFPDIVLYFLIRALTKSMFTALPIYGFVQFGLFVGGLTVFARHVLPEDYKQKNFMIIGVMSALFLSCYRQIHFANQAFLTAHHFGVFAVIPWALALVYQLTLSSKAAHRLVLALFGLSALASFSDLFYVIQFAMPISVGLLALVLMRKIQPKRASVVVVALNLGSAIGYAGYLILASRDPAFKSYLGLYSPHDVIYRYMQIAKHFATVKPYHLSAVLAYVGVCLARVIRGLFAWISPNHISSPDTPGFLYSLYFLLASVVTSLTLAVFGVTIDGQSFRYFLPFILLPAFLGIPYVVRLPKSIPLWGLDVMVVGLCSIIMISSIDKIKPRQLLVNISEDYYPSYVECIDEHAEELGLRYGIAQYWQARPITELSRVGLRVVQVRRDLSVYHWCNNKYWYDMEPEFVIIDLKQPEPSALRLDEKLVIERYGIPDNTFICEQSKILVYTRKDSSLRNLFREYISRVQ